jgi:hypothetical protein
VLKTFFPDDVILHSDCAFLLYKALSYETLQSSVLLADIVNYEALHSRAIKRLPYIQRTPIAGLHIATARIHCCALCFSMLANGALDCSILFHELALHSVTKHYRMKMANHVYSFSNNVFPLKF